jgi:hypothetical protein
MPGRDPTGVAAGGVVRVVVTLGEAIGGLEPWI